MDEVRRCPECGAAWAGDRTCEDDFHELLAWEFEHKLLDVHHLLVLCYHLQHPSLYSPPGLAFGQRLLLDFVVQGMTPEDVRRRYGPEVDSGKRKVKIKATPDAHGAYAHPVAWQMTVGDVVRAAVDRYYDSVRAWARLILEDLRESGNLA